MIQALNIACKMYFDIEYDDHATYSRRRHRIPNWEKFKLIDVNPLFCVKKERCHINFAHCAMDKISL